MTERVPGANRILVVGGEPAGRAFVQRTLESVLLHVDTASRHDQAMEKIRAGGFDVLVLDPTLPRVDGLEILRSIHRDHPSLARRTVVLVEPGSAMVEKLREFPIARTVTRPVSRQDLIAAVSASLREMDMT